MSVLKNILFEEKERLESLSFSLLSQLENYPKGSVRIKKQGKKAYAYRVYRNGDLVHTDYLGKPDSEKVEEFKLQVAKRKKIQDRLKKIKGQYQEVLGAIRGIKASVV